MTTEGNDLQDRNYKRLASGLVGVAFFVNTLYGWQIADEHSFRNAMAAILVGAAPFALGGLAGFLFGIPKTLQLDPTAADGNDVVRGRRHRWQPNTNLEQVSDWLSKILIGVGLTQLQEIPHMVQDTAEYAASALGPNASPAIVAAMLVAFSIAGFVIGYLLTKFDLPFAIDLQDGALEKLIRKNPGDRAAVESYMLSSLYMDPPRSFRNTIDAGEAFLNQEGHPKTEDGNVFAYLACAYGQKHAYAKASKASTGELEQIRGLVLKYVEEALKRAPEWQSRLRQFAYPPIGSTEDDLASLKDDEELKKLLASR